MAAWPTQAVLSGGNRLPDPECRLMHFLVEVHLLLKTVNCTVFYNNKPNHEQLALLGHDTWAATRHTTRRPGIVFVQRVFTLDPAFQLSQLQEKSSSIYPFSVLVCSQFHHSKDAIRNNNLT